MAHILHELHSPIMPVEIIVNDDEKNKTKVRQSSECFTPISHPHEVLV